MPALSRSGRAPGVPSPWANRTTAVSTGAATTHDDVLADQLRALVTLTPSLPQLLLRTPLQLSHDAGISCDEARVLLVCLAALFLRDTFPSVAAFVASANATSHLHEREGCETGQLKGGSPAAAFTGGRGTVPPQSTTSSPSSASSTLLTPLHARLLGLVSSFVVLGTPASTAAATMPRNAFRSTARVSSLCVGARAFLPTRCSELDAALLGGLPVGFVTELVGAPASGKTLLAYRIAAAAALVSLSIEAIIKHHARPIVEAGCSAQQHAHGEKKGSCGRNAPDVDSSPGASSPLIVSADALFLADADARGGVLWVDADQRFCASRFKQVLRHTLVAALEAEQRRLAAAMHPTASTAAAVAVGGSRLCVPAATIDNELLPLLLGRVHVLRVRSLEEFNTARSRIELQLISARVGLLVVDSFATLVRRSFSGASAELAARHEAVAGFCGSCKATGELLGITTVLVNHEVRFTLPTTAAPATAVSSARIAPRARGDERRGEMPARGGMGDGACDEAGGSGVAVSMGNTFHHSVNTRLIVTGIHHHPRRDAAPSGRHPLPSLRVSLAKSPVAPPLTVVV